jgi:hypothetical protein
MPGEPAQPVGGDQPTAEPVAAGSVTPAVVRYTALRLVLMAVLSVLVWLVGVPWLPAVAIGVVLATVVSLTLLRASTRRLSAVLAASSARNRAARPTVAGPADGDPTGDLYDFDPYADDEDEAADPDDLADQQQASPVEPDPRAEHDSQAARINARPSSRP